MQIQQSERLEQHLRAASRQAQMMGSIALMPEIAILSILRDGESFGARIVSNLLKDWEMEQVVLRLERDIQNTAKRLSQPLLDPRRVVAGIIEGVEHARAAAMGNSRGAASTGHLLLWAVGNRDLIAKRILELYGIDVQHVLAELAILPTDEDGKHQFPDFNEEDEGDMFDDGGGAPTKVRTRKAASKSMIDKYASNLTRAARNGDIDPVVGRTREIDRLVQILGRRKKNNPVLIGEPGVGKTAVVEGLALRMASNDAPVSLRGKEIYSLDVASLVAGTKYRGEFEQRIKELLSELTANPNAILFIDEIHTIVGAGSTQGSLDTANILKPALARGELQCIGATTLDEYRENIEADGALERRFQKILVEPSSRTETLEILTNIKPVYERHHSVHYTEEALAACVDLSERYITDRHLPDKAIDIMDEAGSRASLGGVTQVGTAQIEAVVTSMTGIPVERISQNEKERLGSMNESLSGRVIGQSEAVGKVVRSIQRSRAGLKNPNKPIGVFMFVGPTGVGKTHLTKELAKWMFLRPDALVRIDMSEYSEKHNVSRMIGSPPGYVGYNEGGQLTEAVRRQPYAVVLFDEIEKAHPDVFNIMLQIFDDGQLTDGNGRKVDFRNTVIIMTSNVGSRSLAQKAPAVGYRKSDDDAPDTGGHYRAALAQTFAPEFINRIDDIVVFNTLSAADVEQIVSLELDELAARAMSLGVKLSTTVCARKRLAEMGYDPRYGVRALKRTILDTVEEPLAALLIAGEVSEVQVECAKEGIKLVPKIPKAAAA
jgi:ATP-dependent Clp protease ATP-binding subunit ClpC